LPPDLIFQG